jgi:site-specific DNA recombinase
LTTDQASADNVDMPTTGVYMRVSSRQQKDGNSTDSQREAIGKWLEREGLSWSRVAVYEDLARTGRNMNRPAWKAMLQAAEAGKLKRLVFYSLSRAGRSVADVAAFLNRARELGVALVFVKEGFDTSSHIGKAMAQMASVFAELEAESIRERILDGVAAARKERGGKWGAQLIPVGADGGRALTPEQDGELKRLAPKHTDEELARHFKVHRITVFRARKRMGIIKR